MEDFDRRDVLYALANDRVENDQPPEAANVLYWYEKGSLPVMLKSRENPAG